MPKLIIRLIVVLLPVFLLLSGCGSKSKDEKSLEQLPSSDPTPATTPEGVKWTFQPGAIELTVYSDKNLNAYNNYSHTLMLCVYQLTKPAKFNELARTDAGIKKLLTCDAFDPSAVHYQRLFIQPGQNSTISLDRSEGAKFIGVAAGYYKLTPEAATRVYEIPLNKGSTGMLWWSEDQYTPAKLEMNLLLGPHSIQKVGE